MRLCNHMNTIGYKSYFIYTVWTIGIRDGGVVSIYRDLGFYFLCDFKGICIHSKYINWSYLGDLKLSWVVPFVLSCFLICHPARLFTSFWSYLLLFCPTWSMLNLCPWIGFDYFTNFLLCVRLVGESCVVSLLSNVKECSPFFIPLNVLVIVFTHWQFR